jgi:hypothetical protein
MAASTTDAPVAAAATEATDTAESAAAGTSVASEPSAEEQHAAIAAAQQQSAYEAAHAEWKAKWAAWLATVDATTREHFEKRLHALEKPAAAPWPERTVVPRAEDADLAAANEALTKLAELIAAGDVRGSVTLRPGCISSSLPNASRNSKSSASTNWTVRSSASKAGSSGVMGRRVTA